VLSDAGTANFHSHDLRHTFASPLVMAGVDIRTAQELMGHETIQVTMRYALLAPAHQLEAVQRLCNTGSVRSGTTDTMPLELLNATGRDRIKSCISSYLRDNARMAK